MRSFVVGLFILAVLAILAYTFSGAKRVASVMRRYEQVPKSPEHLFSRRVMEHAMELVKRQRATPPEAARLYAYVAASYADALEKTQDEKQAAIAAIALVRHLYPKWTINADNFLASVGLAQTAPIAETQAVTNQYKTRADSDNFIASFNYSDIPTGPYVWYRRTHFIDHPMAGKWKRWVITDSDAVSIPPPPPIGSLQDVFEGEYVLFSTRMKVKEDRNNIFVWNGGTAYRKNENDNNITPSGIWQNVLFVEEGQRLSDREYAGVQKLLAQGIADSFMECWDVKFIHWWQRPSMRITDLDLTVADPEFPSYPSGHSCSSETAAVILSSLFPGKHSLWDRVSASARRARLTGGVHYNWDNIQGARLGRAVAEAILKRLYPDRPIPKGPSVQADAPLVLRFKTAALMLANAVLSQSSDLVDTQSLAKEASLREQMERTPGNVDAYIALGSLYSAKGRYAEAEDILRRAVNRAPDDPSPHIVLGAHYQYTRQFPQALQLFLRALSLSKEKDILYNILGNVAADSGNVAQAETYYKQALAFNPHNDKSYIHLGDLYHMTGRNAQSEDMYAKSFQIIPRQSQAKQEELAAYTDEQLKGTQTEWTALERGRRARKNGDTAAADKLYREALKHNSGDDSYTEFALYLLSVVRFEKAEEMLTRSFLARQRWPMIEKYVEP